MRWARTQRRGRRRFAGAVARRPRPVRAAAPGRGADRGARRASPCYDRGRRPAHGLVLGAGPPPPARAARPHPRPPARHDPRRRARRGGAFGSKGVIARRGRRGRRRGDRTRPSAEVDRGPARELPSRPIRGAGWRRSRARAGRATGGFSPCGRAILADLGAYLLPTTAIPPHTAAMLMTGCYDVPAAAVYGRRRADGQGPDRALPRRGPPRGRVLHRAHRRRRRARAGDRPGRAAAPQPDSHVPDRSRSAATYDSGDYERCLDRRARARPPSGHERPARARARRARASRCTSSARAGAGRAPGRRVRATAGWSSRSSSCPHGQGHDDDVRADRRRPAGGRRSSDIELHFGDSAEVPPGDRHVRQPVGRRWAARRSRWPSRSDRGARRSRRGECSAAGSTRCPVSAVSGHGPDGRSVTLRSRLARAGGLAARPRFDSEHVFASGAYAAAVEIERETGALRIRRLVAVDDAGTIINPLLGHGQVLGGAVQGLGRSSWRRPCRTRRASRGARRCSTTGCRPPPTSRRSRPGRSCVALAE